MTPDAASSRLARWNHFLRWFFNSSPTAMIEAPVGHPAPHAGATKSEKSRRDQPRHAQRQRSQALHRSTAR